MDNELAGMLADLLSFKLQPIYVKDRPQEVKNATCSADKVEAALNLADENGFRFVESYKTPAKDRRVFLFERVT